MGEADNPKWNKAWSEGRLSACKVPELKAFLKSVGLPMAGDCTKRVEMFLTVRNLNLSLQHEGQEVTPFQLKMPDLRRIVAQLGLDPSGDKDELHSLLINYLKSKKEGKGASAGQGSSGSQSQGQASRAGAGDQGLTIAQQILELEDDFPAILSTSGTNITTDSSVGAMRKAYLKLSLLIHPDKLGKTFPEATKAFQLLVTAYERLSAPEQFIPEEEAEAEEKRRRMTMRSNLNCFRTRLFCPRCRGEWGLPDSGVESYDYNFIMMGLRTFNCAGCLFEFGCMTAIHKCPHCRRPFDYHPNDFHRQINCASPSCKKAFGFQIFPISERRELEYLKEIREKQEALLKKKEQLAGRAARAKAKGRGGGASSETSSKEKLFLLALLDECPRCGEEVEERAEHLDSCKDKGKHAAYARKLKERKAEEEERERKKERQEEVQNLTSWEFMGGKTSDMWLLSESQVRQLCEKYGLPTEGEKDEMIASLVRHRTALDSGRMLTSGGEVGEAPAPSASSGKRKLTLADLPSNMESMTVGQLKSVAASFGILIKGKEKETKSGIIKEIERAVLGEEAALMLTEDGEGKKGKRAPKRLKLK